MDLTLIVIEFLNSEIIGVLKTCSDRVFDLAKEHPLQELASIKMGYEPGEVLMWNDSLVRLSDGFEIMFLGCEALDDLIFNAKRSNASLTLTGKTLIALLEMY